MKTYLLTIFNTEGEEKRWAAMSPEEMQVSHKAYMDYTKRLVDEGRLVAGEGLGLKGASLKARDGEVHVTDGPYILAKELIGGVWLFKAHSLEEAVRVAKDCPAIMHGSTVEVREQMDY